MTETELHRLHMWSMLLEHSHKVLTGTKLADENEQVARERKAERDHNFAIKAICGFVLRGEDIPPCDF